MACSDYFVTEQRTISPRMVSPKISWPLSHHSLVKIPYSLAYSLMYVGISLIEVPASDYFSLCQIDMKLVNILCALG